MFSWMCGFGSGGRYARAIMPMHGGRKGVQKGG